MPEPRAAGTQSNDSVDDDNSEWEYEYSASQTDTHFITLDLSIPEFLGPRDDHLVHNNRGAFRQWMSNLTPGDDSRSKPSTTTKKHVSVGQKRASADSEAGDGGDGGDGSEEEDNCREDEFSGSIERPSGHHEVKTDSTGRSSMTYDSNDTKEIQILELHSDRPVIAYRGRVFMGSWTDNIGTEMLFAAGNDDDHRLALAIPGVLRLPQNTNLLGASSARICCTPVEVVREPNTAETEGTALSLSQARQQLGFTIPLYRNASEHRKKQASFLENLMAIKHRQGETDAVTVQALETRQNTAPGSSNGHGVEDDDGRVQKRARLDSDGDDEPVP